MMVQAVPAALAAQQPASAPTVPQTHTVVKGETLWGLAARYLGSGFKWREIYEVNREAIADPHWIYPGEVLRMPGAVTGVAVTVASPAAPAVAPRDTTAPAAPAPVPSPEATSANPANGPTVFPRVVPAQTLPNQVPSTEPETPFPTVLIGEYLSAPYVVKSARIAGAGRLLGSAEVNPQEGLDSRFLFKAFDGVLVTPPAGATGKKGEQYVVLRPGPDLFQIGQVMIPTGIVEVVHDRAGDEAVRAQVVALYGEMGPNQVLVPLDTMGVFTTVRPKPVTEGRSAVIKWVLSEPVIPTLTSYVVLNLKASDGVKPGDEYDVFRPPQAGRTPSEATIPAIPIGKAKVVRVTPYAVTAIVTAQEQPAINVGAMVRPTAKMP
jgi:LysM domain